MGDPPTIQIPSALVDEYRAALEGLRGLTDTNPGYQTAVARAANAEKALLSLLTGTPPAGLNLDLDTAGGVLKDIQDMPPPPGTPQSPTHAQPEPKKPVRLYIYGDPRLDGPSSTQPPGQPTTPPPAAPKPSGSHQPPPKPDDPTLRPKLPATMAPFLGAGWDQFLDGKLPEEDAKHYRAIIREYWDEFNSPEQNYLQGHGLLDEPKPAPQPTPQPPGKTSLPSSSTSDGAVSFSGFASAAGPLLILVGVFLGTFAGCALTTQHLSVAQMETASQASTSSVPGITAIAIPADPRFTVANGTVADIPSAPHIQSGSCSRSGTSTQCNLQLSSDPTSWASQTHGTVGITTAFDNNAVAISWQNAGGVTKPVTSTGSSSSGATAAMAVQGQTVVVSLDGPKPSAWGAGIVVQRNSSDPVHQGILGGSASRGTMLPVTDLSRGAAPATGLGTSATTGASVSAAGANLSGGCDLISAAVGAHGDTLGVMAAPSGADAAHPFLLDWDGTVAYTGHSQTAIKDNTWHVDVFGVQVMSGGDDNKAGETSAQGTINVSNLLPFRFTGLYPVSGAISGNGGACAGNTWVKLAGNPVGTVPWDAGLVLTILGVFGLASVVTAGRGLRA